MGTDSGWGDRVVAVACLQTWQDQDGVQASAIRFANLHACTGVEIVKWTLRCITMLTSMYHLLEMHDSNAHVVACGL